MEKVTTGGPVTVTVCTSTQPETAPSASRARTRTVTPGGMSETIEISSAAARPITAEVSVELGCDLAPIERVKTGGNGTALPAETAGDGRLP